MENRSSDVVSHDYIVETLQKRLKAAEALVGKWNVTYDVAINGINKTISVNAHKSNGSGFIWTISKEDADYYADDPSTLIQMIVQEVYERLIKQELTNDLTPLLIRAVRNAAKLQ
jgi:hypothetical protein